MRRVLSDDAGMRYVALIAIVLAGCGGGTAPAPVTVQPVQQPGKLATVAFFGDSIIARWNIPDGAINEGIGGNTTVQLLARFKIDVLDKRPTTIVLEGGVNDLDREWPPADIANNMAALIIQAQASGARVIVLECLPTKYPHIKAAEYNEELRKVAAVYGVPLLDTYSPFMANGVLRDDLLVDGVHPNAAGYEVIWSVIAPRL